MKLKDILNEISVKAGLKDVSSGRTTAIEGVKMTEHGSDKGETNEAHEAHGVKGHKLNSAINERRYKKKK